MPVQVSRDAHVTFMVVLCWAVGLGCGRVPLAAPSTDVADISAGPGGGPAAEGRDPDASTDPIVEASHPSDAASDRRDVAADGEADVPDRDARLETSSPDGSIDRSGDTRDADLSICQRCFAETCARPAAVCRVAPGCLEGIACVGERCGNDYYTCVLGCFQNDPRTMLLAIDLLACASARCPAECSGVAP